MYIFHKDIINKKMTKNPLFLIFLLFFVLSCAQNSNVQTTQDSKPKTEKQRSMENKIKENDFRIPSGSSLLEGEGLLSLGDLLGIEPGESYAVNSILFNVALDKIAFMPLQSVDANSGVIVTDWYSFDGGETRIKINIRVINEEMNEDSLAINLFKQNFEENTWVDKGMDVAQASKIKTSILSTARNLKIASEL